MLKAKSTLLGLCASLAFVQATTVYATHTPFLTTDVVAIDALTVPGTVPPGTFSLGTYVSGGSETGTSPPNDWDFTSDIRHLILQRLMPSIATGLRLVTRPLYGI